MLALNKHCLSVMVTIPAGAAVEYERKKNTLGLTELRWSGNTYSVHVQDLLDALPVVDAASFDAD